MIADLVRNVGGDRVEVTALMGPGVDPHLYKPSASDVDLLNDADIIFYGGLHLEGRMVETFEAIDLLLVHLLTHEGQRASKPESTLGHVSAALRWSPPQASTVIGRALNRGLIHQTAGQLALTPSGRVTAELLGTR